MAEDVLEIPLILTGAVYDADNDGVIDDTEAIVGITVSNAAIADGKALVYRTATDLGYETIDNTFVGLGNVENTALSTWAGSANVTTLGTITTGTWTGTTIAVANGGTGEITAQAAIDTLSAVSAATDEHVLTKDTASGNAIWKAVAVSGDGVYDGSGTIPTAAISTLTDYWRIDSGDVSIDTGGVPAAKLHIKGDDNLDALRVDADNWNNAFLVQELSGSPLVSVFSNSRVSNEIFRVAGGNAMFSNNITCSGATSVGSAINIADGDFIQIGTTAVFGGSAGTAYIDMGGSGTIDLRNGSDTVVGQFDDSATAGDTKFLVYDVDGATLSRVSVGADDSGGAGFKLLRIPN